MLAASPGRVRQTRGDLGRERRPEDLSGRLITAVDASVDSWGETPCCGGHGHVPWPAGSKSLMAEEAEYPQLFRQRAAAAVAKDRTVADLVHRLFTASSSGCSGSLVGGLLLAAVENAAHPALPSLLPSPSPSPMTTSCPKQGLRPRRRFLGTFCRNTEESTKPPLRCARCSRIWTRSSFSRSIAASLEFRYCRVIASWLTK